MRKIKKYLLSASMLFALVIFNLNAVLACEQHFPDGTIGNCPGQSCEDFIDPGDGTYCVDCLDTAYNPDKAHIAYNKASGAAWVIITGSKPVKIMSDKYVAFCKNMLGKYGKMKRDKVTNEKIKKEYADFYKTDDNKVSATRLAQCAKLMKLKVTDAK